MVFGRREIFEVALFHAFGDLAVVGVEATAVFDGFVAAEHGVVVGDIGG